MPKKPLWLTPERRDFLCQILAPYLAIKGWKLDLITGELYNPAFEARIKPLIDDWKALDRDLRNAELQAELKALHQVTQRRYPLEGRFNAVSRDIYADNQPLFFLRGQAVSGVTLKPFVIARISSSYIRLYVDLSGVLRQVSKSKRRKALRYGKPLPHEIMTEITREVLYALRDYYSH